MKRPSLLFVWFVLGLSPMIFGQRPAIEPTVSSEPAQAAKELYAQAYQAYSADPPRALSLAQEALRFATSANDIPSLAKIHFLLGSLYYQQQSYPQAYAEYHQAQRLFSEVGNQSFALQSRWGQANLYTMVGNPAQAVTQLQQMAKEITPHLDSARLAIFYTDLGKAYQQMGAYAPAISQYQTAQTYTRAPYQLAIIANQMGMAYAQQDQFLEAQQAFEHAYTLATDHQLGYLLGHVCLNLGWQKAQQEADTTAIWECKVQQKLIIASIHSLRL